MRMTSAGTVGVLLIAAILPIPLQGAESAKLSEGPKPFGVGRLRCEYRTNPTGIQTATPGFSWIIESSAPGERQAAFRILAASTEALAGGHKGDLWDSGKVESPQQMHVSYKGAALRAMTRYWWRVQVWNAQGQAVWSPVQHFVTGKLAPADWRGRWIESGEETKNAVYMRKTFSLPKAPVRAYLSICGLGGADVYVNGKRVSEELPITSPSNVPSKQTKGTPSAGYSVHDLTALLKPGENCLGVILGNAFYHSDSWLRQYDLGQVKLICDLDVGFADGASQSVCSDETWKWSYGAIKFHDMRYGQEDFDLRDAMPGWSTAGFDTAAWKPVRLVNPQLPKESLRARQEGPIVVYRTLTPAQVQGNRYTLPEYVAGHVRFKATGPAGHEIVVSNGRKPSKLILRGQGAEPYEQRFCLQGTKDVAIVAKEAKIEDVAFVATATHVDRTGDFACSDPVLNELSRAGYNTARLMTVGMVGAEMEREKAGWGEDGKNALDVGIYPCDMLTVGRKWLQDFLDRQEENGFNPAVIPMVGGRLGGGYNGIWQGHAFVHVAWNLYWHYGDPRILAEAYEGMQRTMRLLAEYAKKDPRQLMGYTLNDWVSAGKQPPAGMTGTIQYYDYALTMARTAGVLGKTDDAKTYADLAASIRANFNRLFWDDKTGHYRDDTGKTTMAIQAMAVWFGMVPDGKGDLAAARLKEMVVENTYHPATGFGSTASLLGVMMRDHPEVAYAMLQEPQAPSFRSNVRDGQCGEKWGGGPLGWASLSGNFNRYVYELLAGIQPLEAGFRKIAILPIPMAKLNEVTCHYDSVSGTIRSVWKKSGDTYTHDVTIPPNTTAVVGVPKRIFPGRLIDRITCDGKTLWEKGRYQGEAAGLKAGAEDERFVRFAAQPGTFRFEARTLVDSQPPARVPGLVAPQVSARVVRLAWAPPPDRSGKLVRYRVYRDGTRLTPEPECCHFIDRQVQPGKVCAYQVSAVDLAGVEGEKSQALTVTLPAPSTNHCEFLAADTATGGAWQGKYGADGHAVCGSKPSLPAYAKLTYGDGKDHVWAPATAETRALQEPGGQLHKAACRYGDRELSFRLDLQGAQPRQVTLYLLDWDRAGRVTTLEVRDDIDSEPILTREVQDYGNGVYLRFAVRGQVSIRLIGVRGNAVLSGVFFGAPRAQAD